MGPILTRTAAYLLSGMGLGSAMWLVLCSGFFPFQMTVALAGILPGATGIAVGGWLLKKASQGIVQADLIVSPRQTMASDMVCVVAAALSWFFVIDGYSARYFGHTACGADPLVSDVIAFMFLPAALVLALVVTQTGNQQIRIDEEGLRLTGASRSAFIPWQDIAAFESETQYVLVGRVGILLPRHLRTNLIIKRHDGSVERIFDPGTGAARRIFAASLLKAMPTHLEENSGAVLANWK